MEPILQIIIAFSILIIAFALTYLLIETARTVSSLREVLILLKTELEPALKSVNGVLTTVNDVTNTAHKNIGMLRNVVATAIGATVIGASKFFSKDRGFIQGFKNGFSKFKK